MRFLLLLLLFGCTTIGHRAAPADWPRLEVRLHYVSFGEVSEKCYPALSLLMKLLLAIPEGCAWIDFPSRTCDVYLRGDAPDPRVLAHELQHCQGKDHVGTSNLANAWREYLRTGGK